jgi:opacity protein-like surface antigen
MKKAIIIILVLFLVNSLFAQTKTAIKLNTGLNVPSSTKYFSDYWGASYNFGGGIDVYLNSQLSLQGYIDYNHFPFDDEKVFAALGDPGTISSGGAINILNLSANLKYNLIDISQKVSPYILGGIGYVNLSLTDLVYTYRSGGARTIGAESVGALSLNFGFGVEYVISSEISIFADARYVLGFTEGSIVRFTSNNVYEIDDKGAYSLKDNTNYIPLRAGISFSL